MFSHWKNRRATKKRQTRNYYVLSGPALGALMLLEIWEDNPDLNLATVRRAYEWCWSTYSWIGNDLGPWHDTTVTLLETLRQKIDDFDWDDPRVGDKDGWSEAMIYYNTQMEKRL